MKKTIPILSIVFMIFSIGCTNGASSNTSTNMGNGRSAINSGPATAATPTNRNNSINDFFINAAQSGMAEVELSREILKTTKNGEIRKFAEMMVSDHTKANTELKQLAAKRNVDLPTDLNVEHMQKLENLRSLTEAERDAGYVDAMISDHNKAIDLFQGQSEDDTDNEVQNFAAKTLPTLTKHLEVIQAIKVKK